MDDLIISPLIAVPESAISFSYSRSGGKGGQNVNKVSTKVEMYVDVGKLRCSQKVKTRIFQRLATRLDSAGKLRISSQESRSQWQNRQTAIKKLEHLIADAVVEEKDRIATKPTRSSKVRRVDSKKLDSKRKQLRRMQVRRNDDE